jgi:pyruvate ferredoxin oxidoreductase alpha subunit
MTKKIEEASRAVTEAVKMCRPKVIPIYPITPQTHNAEALTEYVANGELDATVIDVESEHSAMSAAIGASATGVRTYTASSSQGLKYMSEMLFIAAGLRLPIVMMVANRALSAPINIWNDHSDSLAERDSGWMQWFVESTQEAVDRAIQAFKVAEETLIPVMICMDGFVLTHMYENVDMPSQKDVDAFLPPLQSPYYLDTSKPMTFGAVGPPEHYMEIKEAQHNAMTNAIPVIEKVAKDYAKKFGREHRILEGYNIEDAEDVLVCMGTICGTAREVIDILRNQGKKVGLLKIGVFRPFPRELLVSKLAKNKKLKRIIVLDRAVSTGNVGVVFSEIRDALFDRRDKLEVIGHIVGLGGRDVKREHIVRAFSFKEGKWLR